MPRHPVYALDTTTLTVPGHRFRVSVQQRQVFWSDDDVVLAHPDSFSPVDPAVRRLAGWSESEVEQVTAAPGEKRATRRAS